MTSALVGGIQLNSKIPATFLYENSIINLNIINSAHKYNCKKIIIFSRDENKQYHMQKKFPQKNIRYFKFLFGSRSL